MGWFAGATYNGTSPYGCFLSVLQDGDWLPYHSNTYGITYAANDAAGNYANNSFYRKLDCPGAGSHNYCLTMRATAGGTCYFDTRDYLQFGVLEAK